MDNIRWHTSIRCTLPLTKPTVPSDSPRSVQFTSTRTGVHRNRLADNEAIGNELADCLTGVGIGDFVNLVRVEPDLALAAAGDRRSETLLGAKIDPNNLVRVSDQVLRNR